MQKEATASRIGSFFVACWNYNGDKWGVLNGFEFGFGQISRQSTIRDQLHEKENPDYRSQPQKQVHHNDSQPSRMLIIS